MCVIGYEYFYYAIISLDFTPVLTVYHLTALLVVLLPRLLENKMHFG